MICSSDRSCFPWTLNIKDLSCYTIQNGSKMECLKPCSLNATIGLSTKNSKPDEDSLSKDNSSMSTTSMSKNDISSLGVCVHVDMTPVFISTCELQVQNSFVLRSVCLVFFFLNSYYSIRFIFCNIHCEYFRFICLLASYMVSWK